MIKANDVRQAQGARLSFIAMVEEKIIAVLDSSSTDSYVEFTLPNDDRLISRSKVMINVGYTVSIKKTKNPHKVFFTVSW